VSPYHTAGWEISGRGPHVARHRVFSGRGSIQEKSSNLKFPSTYHSKC